MLHSFKVEEEMMPRVIELLAGHGFKGLKRQKEQSLYDFTGIDAENRACFIESRVRSEQAKTQNFIMKFNKLDRLLNLSEVAPVYVIFVNKYGHLLVQVKDLADATKIKIGETTVSFIIMSGMDGRHGRSFAKAVEHQPIKVFAGEVKSHQKGRLKRVIPLTPERQKHLVGIFSKRLGEMDYDAITELLNLGCWVFLHSFSRQRIWFAHKKLKVQFNDLQCFKARLGEKEGYAFVTESKGEKINAALVDIKRKSKS